MNHTQTVRGRTLWTCLHISIENHNDLMAPSIFQIMSSIVTGCVAGGWAITCTEVQGLWMREEILWIAASVSPSWHLGTTKYCRLNERCRLDTGRCLWILTPSTSEIYELLLRRLRKRDAGFVPVSSWSLSQSLWLENTRKIKHCIIYKN